VATTGDCRPFSHWVAEEGCYRGIDIDLAAELAAALGVELTFVATSWTTLVQDLQRGCFDIALSGIQRSTARERHGLFSRPYHAIGKTPIALRPNRRRFQTLEAIDHPDVKLLTNPGGTNEEFVRQHIHRATVVVHEHVPTLFEQLLLGRADVMITDDTEVEVQCAIHPELCATMPGTVFAPSEVAIFVRPDPGLKRQLDQVLDGLEASGRLGEIVASNRRHFCAGS
jgi:cyclohexadienyl dehydratase